MPRWPGSTSSRRSSALSPSTGSSHPTSKRGRSNCKAGGCPTPPSAPHSTRSRRFSTRPCATRHSPATSRPLSLGPRWRAGGCSPQARGRPAGSGGCPAKPIRAPVRAPGQHWAEAWGGSRAALVRCRSGRWCAAGTRHPRPGSMAPWSSPSPRRRSPGGSAALLHGRAGASRGTHGSPSAAR